ncbi:unnamed protein product [Cyclocybe aegerita]|uniref:Uncharacterized protein n=1 Tax=Cyclocybe aegerita TaxID=1973307 RepID=A0A8S0XT40_CYCAE|nr:unnamed protein product [Cyclocybe aegerita]
MSRKQKAPKANNKKAETCQRPEVQRLRARLREAETEKDRLALELSETKAHLKDTQAFLGQTIMAARMEPSTAASASSMSVAPAEPINGARKRSRSSSITSIDNESAPSSKKAKKKAKPNLPKAKQSTRGKAKSSPQPPGRKTKNLNGGGKRKKSKNRAAQGPRK